MPSGSAVPDATVKITKTDENTTREFKTNGNGDYEAVNSNLATTAWRRPRRGFKPSMPPI